MCPELKLLLCCVLAASTVACTDNVRLRADASVPAIGADATTTVGLDALPPGADAEPMLAPDASPDGLARSEKARVRYKGEPTLRLELATALALPENEVCSELGRYDCFAVHRIALGGVEPYTLGINEPFPDTAVTAPLAIERVALSGCRNRVDRDLADATNAVIFRGIGADSVDPAGSPAREAVDRLYARFQSRHANEDEVAALTALYADVIAQNEPRPGRAWAILSCFAVATSVESLFY